MYFNVQSAYMQTKNRSLTFVVAWFVSDTGFVLISDEMRVEGRLAANGEIGEGSNAGGGAGAELFLSISITD